MKIKLLVLIGFQFWIYRSAYCQTQLILNTEYKTEDRRFLFWKKSHHKGIFKHTVMDPDSTIIMTRRSKYVVILCTADRINERLILLDENNIFEFRGLRFSKKGKLIVYDRDGKLICSEKINKNDMFWRYLVKKDNIKNNVD